MRALQSFRYQALQTVAVLALVAGPVGFAEADDWGDGPSKTTAGSLDDHEAKTRDPDALVVGSGEMVESGSEDPDGMVVGSSEADVVESSVPAAHQGSSIALQDLETEAPDPGYEAIDSGRLANIDERELTATQLLATRRLKSAQAKARAARTTYGDMIRDDYPRGQARLRIVQTRDKTMQALEEARAQFDAAFGN